MGKKYQLYGKYCWSKRGFFHKILDSLAYTILSYSKNQIPIVAMGKRITSSMANIVGLKEAFFTKK